MKVFDINFRQSLPAGSVFLHNNGNNPHTNQKKSFLVSNLPPSQPSPYICAIWQYWIGQEFFDIIVKFVDKFCGMKRRRSRS
jgi:hypothetical protein